MFIYSVNVYPNNGVSCTADDYTLSEDEMEPVHKAIRKKFDIADADKDGRLSKAEFGVFVHPDRHVEMLEHLVQDQLLRYDKDKDGRISSEEYMSKLYNLNSACLVHLSLSLSPSPLPPVLYDLRALQSSWKISGRDARLDHK